MPFPELEVIYKDGSKITITRATLAQDWQTMPVNGIVRINVNPPFAGAMGGFDCVISGGDAYWGYTEGANGYVFGVRCYEWTPENTWDLTKPQYHEWVFDKRAGRVTVEREATSISAGALVRYA